VDLYELSSGSHVHDFNGGILASGLFWTHPVDEEALRFSNDGRRAVLEIENEGVIDSFDFGNAAFLEGTPGVVSLRVAWRATESPEQRGKDNSVPPTDPAAFLGRFAVAESTAEITGSEFGFSFRSDPGVSTERTFAEIGRERNGSFL
jgi:hypothetical protein